MTDQPQPKVGITPHITIANGKAAEAIDFYKQAFDADEVMRMPSPDGRLMHAHLTINGGPLLLNDDFPEMHDKGATPAPAGVALHLDVDDADAWWNRALAAGATVRFPLENQFWGQCYGQVDDPYGHVWSIGGPTT